MRIGQSVAFRTAGIFFGTWLVLALADFPPPRGLIFVVSILLACAFLVAPLTGGACGVEAMTFAPGGTLYATGSPCSWTTMGTHLWTIDAATGAMTLVGSMGLEIDVLKGQTTSRRERATGSR